MANQYMCNYLHNFIQSIKKENMISLISPQPRSVVMATGHFLSPPPPSFFPRDKENHQRLYKSAYIKHK